MIMSFADPKITTLADDINAMNPVTDRDREVAHYVAAYARATDLKLYRVVMEQGRFWTPAPKPDNVKAGTPKQCFDNAYKLASRRSDLRYVEGWALGIIPVHHAWCVDAEGNVIDNTWRSHGFMGASYFGMVVGLNVVKAARDKGNASAFYGAHGLILCSDCVT